MKTLENQILNILKDDEVYTFSDIEHRVLVISNKEDPLLIRRCIWYLIGSNILEFVNLLDVRIKNNGVTSRL